MHMISKKDLNSAEMDTLTKSCSPTIVITANGEVQTHEEAQCMSKNWIYSWLWKSSKTRQQYCRLESFAMKTDILTNGSMVKNHISLKTVFRIQCNTENFVPIVVPGLSASSSSSSHSSTSMTPSRQENDHPTSSSSSSTSPTTTVLSDSETRAREDLSGIDSHPVLCQVHMLNEQNGVTRCWPSQPKIQNQIKRKPRDKNGATRCVLTYRNGCKNSEKIWWIYRVPERRDSHASSSHEPSLEPTPARSVDLGKHSVYTHFPKDRNCEICQRTKITRAPCRRRNGEAVPRAENFGDLITADHKVLSDNCESRNNHRYAVVVQDLATQWIQAYPCKTKTSQETQRSLQKFLEPDRKPKVIYTDNSLEFGKACEDLSWNHCTSTPHRSETNGIAERAVRRVKEGTSAVLLQSGLDENWWADSMECYTLSAKRSRSLIWWEDPIWKTFWETI